MIARCMCHRVLKCLALRRLVGLGIVLTTVLCGSAVYAETIIGRAAYTPWSGYWWPMSQGELIYGYYGSPAPLEKYDLLRQGFFPGSATNWQETHHWPYAADVEAWHGYCVSWTNATIWEGPLDFSPSVNNGILFLIGDKKGLITLAHSRDIVSYEYCNNDPAVFHRWLLTYIGQNKVPLAADLDPSEEMWAYPIYYYQMEVTAGSSYDEVVTSIHCATDDVYPDYDGTKPIYRTYTYRLNKDANGNYTNGEWTGASASGHPEMVWIPTSQAAENPYIDIDAVRELVASSDDESEGEATLGPGHYLLSISPGDSDSFTWDLPQGSSLRLTAVCDDQSSASMATAYTLAHNGAFLSEGQITHTPTALSYANLEQGAYRLSLSGAPSNTITAHVHLYVDIVLDNTAYLLDLPRDVDWIGLGLHNPGGTANRYYVSYHLSEQGLPAASVEASASLAANGHWAGVLPLTLAHDYFSSGTPALIRVTSQTPVTLFELFGQNGRLWGPPQKQPLPTQSARQWVIPALTAIFDSSATSRVALFNAGSQDGQYAIAYYYDSGTVFQSATFDLEAQQYRSYIAGSYPGAIDHDGWALVSDPNGQLLGSTTLQQGTQMGDALPLLTSGQHFYLPHVAIGSDTWQTRLTLFNITASSVALTLTCRQDAHTARQISIQLNPYEKRELPLNSALLGMTSNQIAGSWLEISAGAPVAGYCTYQFQQIAMASIPLMGDETLANTKYLGHVAVDQRTWWTGLALLNPDSQPAVVDMIGRDDNGVQLATAQRTLPALEKSVISVAALFPGYSGRIKSIQMTSTSAITGVALYGTQRTNNQLSGIVLD